MKLIVTGGAGFVGTSLCLGLKHKYPDYTIIAFDNLKRRGSEFNLQELNNVGIEFIHGDIRNSEDLDAVQDFDVLIDASAEPSILAGLAGNPTYVINNNLFGSVNCFNRCLKASAKLIFLSTSRVYPIELIEKANILEEELRYKFASVQSQKGISQKGISEELSLSGYRSFYGATKLSSELLLQEYGQFYGLKYAITRLGVVAGPRQMGKSDQGVATLWMAKHYWNQKLKYIGYGGKGKQVRDILHIEDLVDLIDLQIHQTEMFSGEIFNAGGGTANSVSLLDMSDICREITGNTISFESEMESRPADLRLYITDNTKIETKTGWKPKRGVQDVFVDIFNWIRENESSVKAFLK